jgi:hypothetical protein
MGLLDGLTGGGGGLGGLLGGILGKVLNTVVTDLAAGKGFDAIGADLMKALTDSLDTGTKGAAKAGDTGSALTADPTKKKAALPGAA